MITITKEEAVTIIEALRFIRSEDTLNKEEYELLTSLEEKVNAVS